MVLSQAIALTGLLSGAAPLLAQENVPSDPVPIERCDRLPVVTVRVEGEAKRFLVDTAATSMLNLKSFPGGRRKRLDITSYSGTSATEARVVTLRDFTLGQRRLENLSLPAIDLSRLAEACGGPIDGILGIDLLERLGVTLDLKRQLALIPAEAESAEAKSLREEHRAHGRRCMAALMEGDLSTFGDCLHPDVAVFGFRGEFRGREELLAHIREAYFNPDAPTRLLIRDTPFQVLPEVAWYGFEFWITQGKLTLRVHGMGVCRRGEDGWRIVALHTVLDESGAGAPPTEPR